MSSRATGIAVRILVAVAVVGGLIWFLRGRGAKSAEDAAAASGSGSGGGSGDRTVAVQVAAAKRESVPIWLEGLGTVAALQQVTVRSQVDGRLEKVLFEEGQPVKAGQVIAQIDPRPFVVQLHSAQGALTRDRATLATAQKNYERYKSLVEQKLVAQQQLDEIQAQVGNAKGAIAIDQAGVEAAQLQLDYTHIKSPLDGIAGVRIVDAGNLIRANDTTGLVVVTKIDPAAVLFTVPQDRLTDVSAAMARGPVPVEIWNRDGTSQLGSGTLTVLDNQVNQSTGTLRLKAIASNPKGALWPNAFVKARMLVETMENALTVPAVAIQRGPQGTYVYVVTAEKKAELKPVVVLMQTGDKAILSKGLDGGESVVVEGASQIRPGGKVEPKDAGKDAGKTKPGARAESGSGSGSGSTGGSGSQPATAPGAVKP